MPFLVERCLPLPVLGHSGQVLPTLPEAQTRAAPTCTTASCNPQHLLPPTQHLTCLVCSSQYSQRNKLVGRE